MVKKNLGNIVVAETEYSYHVVFEDTYFTVEKDADMQLLRSYIQGISIGCYCSGNLLNLENLIQNGPSANSKWSFIGKPLTKKKFQTLCDSFSYKDEGFHWNER